MKFNSNALKTLLKWFRDKIHIAYLLFELSDSIFVHVLLLHALLHYAYIDPSNGSGVLSFDPFDFVELFLYAVLWRVPTLLLALQG
ncbi:hypothetical protein VNO77_20088 [Canavalia gladiata]|uniref:Uncharacterized protein n=1 Tax=Canavalia gladiata TaxID=3824 RepID=A0AAN9QQ84_CANGL